MKIEQATQRYEKWMRSCAPVVEKCLRDKHTRMREDPFQFLRGSYYRWAQLWPEVCSDFAHAPVVLSAGDLHVDNFGTWRDAEGRLCWGVNDFDEAFPLPYTNDLIRLVASIKVARKLDLVELKTGPAAEIIVDAYRNVLRDGGCPIVLAEEETHLEKLGIAALKGPEHFWEKLNARRTLGGEVPQDAKRALQAALPESGLECRFVRREAGVGSLGRERYVAIAECYGGFVAREAKRLIPAANTWLDGGRGDRQWYYQKVLDGAMRSHDPYQKMCGAWLIRRLSPDANPIHMEELSGKRDEKTLFRAMGTEIANVHLGSRAKIKAVLRDLGRRRSGWLADGGRKMAKLVVREWKEYRA
jgi:hypothetical protein